MVKSSRRKSRTRRSPSRRSPSRRRRRSPSRRRRRSRMEGGDALRNQYSTAATEAAVQARVIKALRRRRGRGYEDIQRCLLLIDQAAEQFGSIAGDIMLDKLREFNNTDPDTVGYYCFEAFRSELYQMLLIPGIFDDDTRDIMWDTFYQSLDNSIIGPSAAPAA